MTARSRRGQAGLLAERLGRFGLRHSQPPTVSRRRSRALAVSPDGQNLYLTPDEGDEAVAEFEYQQTVWRAFAAERQ